MSPALAGMLESYIVMSFDKSVKFGPDEGKLVQVKPSKDNRVDSSC